MVRILLEHGCRLYREALSAVMSREDDLQVVGEAAGVEEVPAAVVRDRADVAVLVAPIPGHVDVQELCRILADVPEACGTLVVLDRKARYGAGSRLARMAPRVGITAAEASLDDLIAGIRCLARGEPVLDIELAVAALTAQVNPLTDREREVLRLVMTGATTLEVAKALSLSAGTVRNYLSQILLKTAARSRVEAIRIAHEAGWI